VVRWQDTRLSFKVCWAPARSEEALRRRRADLPVVLASSYAAPMLTERALAAEITESSRNPFSRAIGFPAISRTVCLACEA